MKNNKKILGFDEVGRGPLAGPVVVACVLGDKKVEIPEEIIIRDSKKMTEKQKEKANIFIRKNYHFGIGEVSPSEIDKKGISNAVRKAASLALKNFMNKTEIDLDNVEILIDGRDEWIVGGKTVIKGDNKVKEISMASIIAKVYRDEKMRKLGEKYPEYFFGSHVGYGTSKHIQAIRKYGLIEEIHRKSFCKKFI